MIGIDTGAVEKEEFFDIIFLRSVDDIGLDHAVVVEELCGIGINGQYASNFGSSGTVSQVFGRKNLVDSRLVSEIKLGTGTMDDIIISLGVQFSHDG